MFLQGFVVFGILLRTYFSYLGNIEFCILMFVLGTLGYIMSEVEEGKPLSQVVKAAKNLGYTEPGL